MEVLIPVRRDPLRVAKEGICTWKYLSLKFQPLDAISLQLSDRCPFYKTSKNQPYLYYFVEPFCAFIRS